MKSIKEKKLVEKLTKLLEQRLYSDMDIEEFCNKNNISPGYLRKIFKEHTGFTPLKYFINLKLDEACILLLTTELNITQTAFELNFENVKSFSNFFRKYKGILPKEFIKRENK